MFPCSYTTEVNQIVYYCKSLVDNLGMDDSTTANVSRGIIGFIAKHKTSKTEMETTISLPKDLEVTLRKQANEKGVSLDALIVDLLNRSLGLNNEEDDTLMSKEEFFAKIERAEKNIELGNCYEMKPGETLDTFLERMTSGGYV